MLMGDEDELEGMRGALRSEGSRQAGWGEKGQKESVNQGDGGGEGSSSLMVRGLGV